MMTENLEVAAATVTVRDAGGRTTAVYVYDPVTEQLVPSPLEVPASGRYPTEAPVEPAKRIDGAVSDLAHVASDPG